MADLIILIVYTYKMEYTKPKALPDMPQKPTEPLRLILKPKPIANSINIENLPPVSIASIGDSGKPGMVDEENERASKRSEFGLKEQQVAAIFRVTTDAPLPEPEVSPMPTLPSMRQQPPSQSETSKPLALNQTDKKMIFNQFEDLSETSSKLNEQRIVNLKDLEELLNRLFRNENVQITDLDLNYAELHVLVEVLMRKNRKFNFK